MCGIVGIATIRGERTGTHPGTVERMRDRLSHRGPDSAGIWDGGHIILAHRRLAVLDPTQAGAQPMHTPDGACTIVYNGELYNDAELRRELSDLGVAFRTATDTETILHALAHWGPEALGRFRGMFALGFYDRRRESLLLARDPLGIKPLYFHHGAVGGRPALVFASEMPAILAHPDISAHPDFVTISAYLTTIRTVLGSRTLFQDVQTLRPGEAILFDLAGPVVQIAMRCRRAPAPAAACPPDFRGDSAPALRRVLDDSIHRHLRSDVPLCCLLSGGLDSTIIASRAMHELGELHTYCAGAAATCDDPPDRGDTDFAYARRIAAALGTHHTEVPITPSLFAERWREMVEALGTPLSTPNEIAIREVSQRLRDEGHVVTLSGEGADELFGGYSAPLRDAEAFIAGRSFRGVSPGVFQLLSNAWIVPEAKATLLTENAWRNIKRDEHLIACYETEFAAIADEGATNEEPLQPHLRFLRRINLAGLLQRLDTATMLARVEGRTPFADAVVCAFAESMPMKEKFRAGPDEERDLAATKRVLRRAYAAEVPPEILIRPKASFPLPFQEWLAPRAHAVQQCDLVRELFTPAAIEAVRTHPERVWSLSWPMINLALWAQCWW